MPKINRIRIVNFSYNNNNRHIIDEMFDLYQGENALLSLANGGGKSVLVQAVLQPILPKVSLLKRKFGDFFIAKRTPSYIMLEWLLDDEAGYLLTGIAVTSAVSQAAGEDEQNADIRYFTFLHAYEEGNQYDIKGMPVTEQVGSSVRIASYHELKKLLQKQSGKRDHAIDVYDATREEQKRYTRDLSSYGISREEWKELIVNINEAENGVSEVFSECRTSRKVMEQWVIKYIEKVLDKSAEDGMTDHKKLETMMAQVAQSLVDNENHIREYQTIEGFSRELGELSRNAKKVLNQLDQEDKLQKEIAGGYRVLNDENGRLTSELEAMEKRLIELDIEIERITHEEKSQEIYEYTKQVQEIDKSLSVLRESINEMKTRLEEREEWLKQQKAAEKYKKILEKQKEIAELQQRLENIMKDQDELKINLNQVMYSLKVAYNGRILEGNNAIAVLNAQLRDDREAIERNRAEQKRYQQQIEELKQKVGGVTNEITHFENEEPAILKGIGVELYRNPLLKELDPQEIAKVKNQLAENSRISEERLINNQNEAGRLADELEHLRQSYDELMTIKENLKIEESKLQTHISDYGEEKQKAMDALKRLNIREDYLFDRDYQMNAAKEVLNEWENKVYHLKMEINALDRQIHGIEQGISYLPENLAALLKENNLPCYTGEKYLRDIDETVKAELIRQNPFLPYSLIATEKEIAIITQLVSDMEISQVIPVIRHNEKDRRVELNQGNMQFITASKNIMLNSGDILSFVNSLAQDKKNRMDELEKANDVIDRVNHDYQCITGFNWTEKQVNDLLLAQSRNTEEINKNTDDLKACMMRTDELNREKAELAQQIHKLEGELITSHNKIQEFGKYLNRNDAYMANVQAYSRILGEIRSCGDMRSRCENAAEILHSKETETRKQLEAKKNETREYESKLAEVADAQEAVPIAAEIPELEGKLEACRKKQNDEAANLSKQIRGFDKDILYLEKDIDKMKLKTEAYKSIEYSEELESDLETQCNGLHDQLNALAEEEKEHELNHKGLTGKIYGVKQSLGGKPVVPVEEIRGNFTKRREAAVQEKEGNKIRGKRIQQEQVELAGLISKIETEIKGIHSIAAETGNKTFNAVKENLDTLLQEYNSCRAETSRIITGFAKSSTGLITSYTNNEEGTVKDAIKGLQYQLNTLDRSFDKYYYLTERMDYYDEQLSQILKIMESKMLQLEHSRNDLVEHAFIEASRIYHEIPKISENSAVEIDGVRKRVLEIQYDEMGDELQAREKMNQYIQDCLNSLTKLIKEDGGSNNVSREVAKYMSTKELLNIISSLENCRIKAYKVDLNEKNRRMMLWEDIIVKNSGGEKFVAYFSLLVALISYSRKQIRGYQSFQRKEESKVLIMDNPFGPITSGHLLKPMFDIAKKYNTQLICLSDIKQGSVLNSFDLIYMIKIRQNMMQEDFIELEPIFLKDMKQDEKLEKAHLYGRIEQASLFD
ncbi:MAG: hypothetical protein KBA53_06340 [Thermoclostridium sp.]|nr:hypothetical protein [Thermoclostridium sp.]